MPAQTVRPPTERSLLPRLLGGGDRSLLSEHLERFGSLPLRPGLVEEVERAGLTGRGGAGFPTGRKMRAVASGRGPAVVVANGTEGEPLSAKDRTLLQRSPHLVLDGIVAAAAAVGASRAVLCIEAGSGSIEAVRRAVEERSDPLHIEIALTPKRYVAGQETALVRWINGGEAKPIFGLRPYVAGVGKSPTLVDNVETLANIALIARFGAEWFRQVGTEEEPGSALVTLQGGLARPGVYEISFGTPLKDLLASAGALQAQALLIGGYYGRWVSADKVSGLRMSSAGLARAGARFGCGVVAVIPDDICALDELAAVARWYARNSAGQCGACVHGLDDIAGAVQLVVDGEVSGQAEDSVRRWAEMVRGRGGCQFPDGAADFVLSGLDALQGEIADHRRGACVRRRNAHLLPTPKPGAWR